MEKNVVTASEAKANFFEVSEKAAKGEEVVISKKGIPQTVMISYARYRRYRETEKKKKLQVLDQIAKHRRSQKVQADSVELISELRQGRYS